MAQLAIAATYHFLSLRFLKCEYQANVMNTLDNVNKIMVLAITDKLIPSSAACKLFKKTENYTVNSAIKN